MENLIKKYKNTLKSISLLSVMLLIIGCSGGNDLTRNDAKKLILSSSEYPQEITADILLHSYFDALAAPDTRNFNLHAEKIMQTKVATAAVTTKPVYNAQTRQNVNRAEIKVSLTEGANKYVRGNSRSIGNRTMQKMATYIINFGEVTGIMMIGEDKSMAKVEYTEIYEPTPFAIVVPSHFVQESVKKEAFMQLYDDGWRVTR
jgi:hypothetical protein